MIMLRARNSLMKTLAERNSRKLNKKEDMPVSYSIWTLMNCMCSVAQEIKVGSRSVNGPRMRRSSNLGSKKMPGW